MLRPSLAERISFFPRLLIVYLLRNMLVRQAFEDVAVSGLLDIQALFLHLENVGWSLRSGGWSLLFRQHNQP